MTILNIEDDKNAQDAFKGLVDKISDGEVVVYQSTTLAEGIALDHEKRPSIVLLDLMLPDSPVWQDTVAKIKEFLDPVIIVTGLDVAANNYEIFMACTRAGARRVFEKPQMLGIWKWLGESPKESFAARLLGTAGTIHLDQTYGKH